MWHHKIFHPMNQTPHYLQVLLHEGTKIWHGEKHKICPIFADSSLCPVSACVEEQQWAHNTKQITQVVASPVDSGPWPWRDFSFGSGKKGLVRSQQCFSLTPVQHQPPATSQPAVFFSHNKLASTTSHQPAERDLLSQPCPCHVSFPCFVPFLLGWYLFHPPKQY
jgi:hypothetical protein